MNQDLGLSSSFSAPKEKKLGDDDKPPNSSLSSAPEEKNVKNDNEPRGSLSSFAIEAKQPRTTMNQDPNLLSSFAFEEKTK
jgi:hypothetical protein